MEDKDLEYSIEQFQKDFYKSMGIPESLTEVQSNYTMNSLPLTSFKFKFRVWWLTLKFKLEMTKLIWSMK